MRLWTKANDESFFSLSSPFLPFINPKDVSQLLKKKGPHKLEKKLKIQNSSTGDASTAGSLSVPVLPLQERDAAPKSTLRVRRKERLGRRHRSRCQLKYTGMICKCHHSLC